MTININNFGAKVRAVELTGKKSSRPHENVLFHIYKHGEGRPKIKIDYFEGIDRRYLIF